MMLKNLLNLYKKFDSVVIVDENYKTIDKGTNALCLRALYGDKKVLKFEASNVKQITIMIEKGAGVFYEK